MKKALCLFALVGLIAYSPLKAQDQKSTVCLNAGVSLVGQIVSLGDVDGEGSTTALPAIQLTYDYMLNDWFSLGAAGSFQKMSADVIGYTYIDEGGNIIVEDVETSLNRLNFAARALFHYGNFENLDMYSGIRLGYTNWSYSTDSSDPDYVDDIVAGGFAPQLVAFGIRGYFTDAFGVNVEFAIGPPSYLSAGLNLRF